MPCTRRTLAILGLALLAAVACSEDDDDIIVAPVAIHDGTWSEDDGALAGELVEEDGCLVVLTGGQRILPAFVDDRVTWDPPSHTLMVHGKEFRPGTTASFGGGGGSRRELTPGTSWVNAPPDTCATIQSGTSNHLLDDPHRRPSTDYREPVCARTPGV